MSTNYDSFDHVHLQEVDPSFSLIEAGVYTLQVQEAGMKEFEYKKGDRAGQKGKYIKFRFTVVDDDNFSGRKVFETMFPSEFTFKALRRLMDAIGIPMAAGDTLEDWLGVLQTETPRFRIQILKVVELNADGTPKNINFKGEPAEVNKLNWKEVLPA